MTEKPHLLILDEDGEFDVEHPGCQVAWDEMPKCGIEAELGTNGMQQFFTTDPEEITGYYDPTLITVPGRYWIEYWSHVSRHWEYGLEYDSGIKLLYPEESING